MTDLAVLVVNYNKRDLLIKCLDSIFASDEVDFDVFVVDNASKDGSVDAVKKYFKDRVTLLVNDENTGGAGGFHRGMEHISGMNQYKYIAEFDNDILVKSDAIRELRRYMEKNPNVAACGATIIDMENLETVYEMGAFIDVENFRLKLPFHQVKYSDLPDEVTCDYVAFGASIILVDSLKNAGLPDKDFFIFWDDMEFCWRLRKSGYKVCAISAAVVYHCSPSVYQQPMGSYYRMRNQIVCFARHTDAEIFENLAEIVTGRFFRTMVVNINTPERANAYTHALFDALNGVMGKAEAHKVAPLATVQKWHSLVKGKGKIIVHEGRGFTQRDALASILRSVTDAPIAIASDNMATDNNTLHVITCYHILDIDYTSLPFIEGETLIWDNYQNFICDAADFSVFSAHKKFYPVFHSMLYGYIKNKLNLLREAWG
ncbi:MAG: glycosyltransferase family 2 protein [Defluviitaleaceae bacterium]|nr:glycosyltransferase family 2 protein [Defluviitaleaceae bacterium]MCL2239567.1 glycosyltransferase family 2 protein [Defluviitaleaceae bacterium]